MKMMGFKLVLLVSLQLVQLCQVVLATKDVAEAYFGGIGATEKTEYNNWLDANYGSAYSHHTFLSSASTSGDGAAVFWKINGDEINFGIAARASGWLSFGISEAGGMLGSDVVYYEDSNPDQVVDSYIMEGRSKPLKDDCQSWNLVSVTVKDGWLILEVNRKLDTGDSQDRQIIDDSGGFVAPTRLIAAWGDTPSMSYHGTKSGRNSVRLFAEGSIDVREGLISTLNASATGYFDVRELNFTILPEHTNYHEICRTAAEIKQEIQINDDTLTVIGTMPEITEATRQYVHHFTVHVQASCEDGDLDRSMIFAWAPGDEGWALPDHVGFPLFERANRQAIVIQTHYNNPELVQGAVDSSGVRFFYVKGERQERAGILEIGDPTVSLYGEQINPGLTQYEFSCPGTCSNEFMGGSTSGDKGVTILAEYLHMHETGVRMTNEVIRDNEVVHKSKIDVFEFDQQGNFLVQQEPFEVKAGDAFRTSCYYRDGAEFGLASEQEMCIAFIMYYPAMESAAYGFPWICPYNIPIPLCEQELSRFDLQDEAGLDRDFGTSSGKCNVGSGGGDPTNGPTLAPVGGGDPNSGGNGGSDNGKPVDSSSTKENLGTALFSTLVSGFGLVLLGGP